MFLYSQTFYIDPDSVQGASQVYVTSVDLFCAAIPSATNSSSGIINPSVAITLSPTVLTSGVSIPQFNNAIPLSTVVIPYSDILVDPSATTNTNIKFASPILLNTAQTYALNIQADDSNFEFWYASKGDYLVSANTSTFSGFSGGFQGELFQYGSDGNLTPVTGTQLKYNINCAKFTGSTSSVELVNADQEFLVLTNQNGYFLGGETVELFQSNSIGTVSTIKNSTAVSGTNTIFSASLIGNYIGIYSGNTIIGGKIANVSNTTLLTLEQPATQSINSTNYFTSIGGTVYYTNPSTNNLMLSNSSANSLINFASAPNFTGQALYGSSYILNTSNTSNLFINQPVSSNDIGFSVGTTITNLSANQVTLSSEYFPAVNTSIVYVGSFTGTATTGNNTIVNVSNTSAAANNLYLAGDGISPSATITSITGNTITISLPFTGSNGISTFYSSNGYSTVAFSGLNQIVGLTSNTIGYISSVMNYPASTIEPQLNINLPSGTSFALTGGFVVPNGNGFSSGVYANLTNYKETSLSNMAFILSKSNEVQQSNLYTIENKSESINVNFTSSSNNSYSSASIDLSNPDTFVVTYQINNTLSGENTDAGMAASKYISNKISLGKLAQDFTVLITGNIPAGTSVVPFAKLYNSSDSDSFNDKQWTLLPVAAGTTALNSPDSNTQISLTFGIPSAPDSYYTANGTVTLSSGSNTIIGSSTNFGTEIGVGNVVKIWDPLFPNNFAVSLVTEVNSTTSLQLADSFANTNITKAGMKLDLVANPLLGFINPQNYNVVRYYNSVLSPEDGFDTCQVKLVLLSTSKSSTPVVTSLSAIGVSA